MYVAVPSGSVSLFGGKQVVKREEDRFMQLKKPIKCFPNFFMLVSYVESLMVPV